MPSLYNSYMLSQLIFSNYLYISVLIFSVLGLLLADYRYKTAFFDIDKRVGTIKSIGIVMSLLLLFDVLGIINNIFSTNQRYVSGVYLFSPDLPLEEFIFLFLLCYFCLILYIFLKNNLSKIKDRDV